MLYNVKFSGSEYYSGIARGVHVGSSAPNPYTSAPTLLQQPVTSVLVLYIHRLPIRYSTYLQFRNAMLL
jgi:hypothetical protein